MIKSSRDKVRNAADPPAVAQGNVMRALVIGASGQIGGALLRTLGSSGWTVFAAARQPRSDWLGVDIVEPRSIREALGRARPEVVFLAAALGSAEACEEHPELAMRTNGEGPGLVARAAREVDAKLVFYSSDYIFDGTAGPYGEDDLPSPINVYGRAKVRAEAAIREELDDWLIVRTTVVFGWEPQTRNFAAQLYNKLIAGLPMRVPSDQVGTPTYVEELAEISQRLAADDRRGVYNVVGADRVSRANLAHRLAARLGLDQRLLEAVPTSELDQIARRPLQAGLTTTRLKDLGIRVSSLDMALERLARRAACHHQ